MWRFNEARQDHGPNRRRGDRSRQRRLPLLESLEGRQLLNCGGPSLPRAWPPPAIVNPTPIQGAAKASVAADLTELSNLYQRCHSDLASLEARFPELQFQGNAVLVAVEGQGDVQTLTTSLGGLRMKVTSAPPAPTGIGIPLTSPILFVFHRGPSGGGGTEGPTSSSSSQIVEGYLPIDQIQAVAELPQVVRVSAVINTDAPDIIRPGTRPRLFPPTLPPAPAPIVIPSPSVPGPTLPPAPAPIVIPSPAVSPPTLPPAPAPIVVPSTPLAVPSPPVSPPPLPPAPIVIPPPPFKLPGPPVRIPGLPSLRLLPPVIVQSPSPAVFPRSSAVSSPLPTDSLGILVGTGEGTKSELTHGSTSGATDSNSVGTPTTPAPAPPPYRPLHNRAWSGHVVHRHAASGHRHGG